MLIYITLIIELLIWPTVLLDIQVTERWPWWCHGNIHQSEMFRCSTRVSAHQTLIYVEVVVSYVRIVCRILGSRSLGSLWIHRDMACENLMVGVEISHKGFIKPPTNLHQLVFFRKPTWYHDYISSGEFLPPKVSARVSSNIPPGWKWAE